MLTIQLLGAEAQVLDGSSPSGEQIRVLLLADPATGIQVHVPLKHDQAMKLGAALAGRAPVIATQMPKPAAARK